ncbi:MAG: dihydroneopterin triphosphate diphosphatase [Dechloromonas sp.]|jgi:dATP pyrophosphohydrolase|nr:dihydroneopterin triphosphate diphosphatase [Dechloromonas sp.]
MNPYKQPVSVLVVLHTVKLDVLLLERAAHPGYWQSVTGSREGQEALAETARREVFEETGFDTTLYELNDWQLSHRYEIFPQWRHRYAPGITENAEHVFSLALPKCLAPRIASAEHRDWVWMPWQAAAARCFSWSNRDAILALPQRQARKDPTLDSHPSWNP